MPDTYLGASNKNGGVSQIIISEEHAPGLVIFAAEKETVSSC